MTYSKRRDNLTMFTDLSTLSQLPMRERRKFLKMMSAVPMVAVAASLSACGGGLESQSDTAYQADTDADLWGSAKDEFEGDSQSKVMDVGSMSVTLKSSVQRIGGAYPQTVGVGTLTSLSAERNALAGIFGVITNQIALVPSASSALTKIILGFCWERGDVLVTSSQEHPITYAQIELAKSFYGIEVAYVDVGDSTLFSGEEVVKKFEAVVHSLKREGRRPRIVLWSSPTYMTGAMIPPRQMAAMAKSNGLISICDAAHLLGMVNFDVDVIGADFLICSGSKWQPASKGTGLIFLNKDQAGGRLLANLDQPGISLNLDYAQSDLASRLSVCNSNKSKYFDALIQSCRLWDKIGRDQISVHILRMNEYLRQLLEREWGEESIMSRPIKATFASGMLTFIPYRKVAVNGVGAETVALAGRLKDAEGFVVKPIRIKSVFNGSERWAIRICTPLWIDKKDIDKLVAAMKLLH